MHKFKFLHKEGKIMINVLNWVEENIVDDTTTGNRTKEWEKAC